MRIPNCGIGQTIVTLPTSGSLYSGIQSQNTPATFNAQTGTYDPSSSGSSALQALDQLPETTLGQVGFSATDQAVAAQGLDVTVATATQPWLYVVFGIVGLISLLALVKK